MPVFSTAAVAVLAVGSAVGTAATVAAVATAVVTVSAAIGVVGLALSVVGAITGDKTIGKIGKYMGYAGIVGGLAGAAVGGIGALSSGGGFLQGAMAPFSEAANLTEQIWNDYGNLNMFTGSKSIADQATLLNATRNGMVPAITNALPTTDSAGDVWVKASTSATETPPLNTGDAPGGFSQNGPQADALPTGGAPQATAPPVNPGAPLPAAAPANPTVLNTDAGIGSGILQTGANLQVTNPAGVPGVSNLRDITASPGGFGAWFNAQDSFTKYAVLQGGTTALQGVGGALGGLFTAATEEEKLKFEHERQAFIQSQQGLMNKRTAMAPSVTFDQTRPVRPAGRDP